MPLWLLKIVQVYAGPDSQEYAKMALGQRTVHPFAARIGVPLLAKATGGIWSYVVISRLCLLASVVLYLNILASLGMTRFQLAMALALMLYYGNFFQYLWRYAILTDQAAGLLVLAMWWSALRGDVPFWAAFMALSILVREWNLMIGAAIGLVYMSPEWLSVLAVTAILLAIFMVGKKALPCVEPDPQDKRYWPPWRTIFVYPKHNWRLIYSPTYTWKAIGVFAIFGAFHASPEVLKIGVIIPVCFSQGLFASDLWRFHTHAWPAVIALAVSVGGTA